MSGLARICKMYGRLKAGGVVWVYDYAADEPVRETEMPIGSERWLVSERARLQPLMHGDAPNDPE